MRAAEVVECSLHACAVSHRPRPWGWDLSEHALTLAASRATGATLATGTVDQLPFPRSQFDFVLSLDVIRTEAWTPAGQLTVNVAALIFYKAVMMLRLSWTGVIPAYSSLACFARPALASADLLIGT